ncbi:beta-L-arabinofuranosidase domain-containing protein [Lentisphaerota bacterium WC36G]|nr:glycoside hydrolase family 127 protein [Lentisphaerae bacterium WC36]
MIRKSSFSKSSVKVLTLASVVGSIAFAQYGCLGLNANKKSHSLSVVKAPYQDFERLPMGSIKPQGWLWNVAEMQSENYSRELEKHDKIFRNEGWFSSVKTNDKRQTWWPYEQTGYFIDGTIRMGAMLDDNNIEHRAVVAIDRAVERSKKDPRGYYYIDQKNIKKVMFKENSNVANRNPEYPNGHYWAVACFNRGVLALYEQTGDKKYLDMLEKMYLNFPLFNRPNDKNPITPIELHNSRRLVNIEVMFDVYRYTGNKKILEKALDILKRNESGMVRQWNEQKDFSTTMCVHGVTYNEMAKQYATAYSWTGNKDYLNASVNAYEQMQKYNMLPIGVNSSNEYFRGDQAFQAAETCNSADFLWANAKMFEVTGNSIYLDRLEKVFFNAGFGVLSDDFSKYAYVQVANALPKLKISGHKPASMTQMKHVHRPACCAGNITRILPNYVSTMVMRKDNGLAIGLYGPATVKSYTPSGNEVNITMKTNYPFTEDINISVEPKAENDNFTLSMRIPKWCKNPSIEVNGDIVPVKIDKNGFASVSRKWNAGDYVYLKLAMTPEINTGKETYIKTLAKKPFPRHEVKETNRPYATVNYGPLLFAFTGDKNEKFNYALNVNEVKLLAVKRDEEALNENFSFNRKNPSPLKIIAKLQPINYSFGRYNRSFTMPGKIYEVDTSKQKEFNLVPYSYATKYRMSMFPVAE